MEHRFFDAFPLLVSIVIEQPEHIFAKAYNCHKVAGRNQGHTQITQVPDYFKTGQCSKHNHHTAREDTVDGKNGIAGGHKTDIRLSIVLVSDNRRKGKEEDGRSDENRPC